MQTLFKPVGFSLQGVPHAAGAHLIFEMIAVITEVDSRFYRNPHNAGSKFLQEGFFEGLQ